MELAVIRAECTFKDITITVEKIAEDLFKRIRTPNDCSFTIWDRCYFKSYEISIVREWNETIIIPDDDKQLYGIYITTTENK